MEWHQPHFPGYPVYIAAGKLAALLAGSPEGGLILVSIISMTLAILAMARLAAGENGAAGRSTLALALMATPMMFQFSHKILSEPMGLALLTGAALAICPRWGWRGWFTGGALLGLMLGVRLSWWPMTLGFFISDEGRKNHRPLLGGVLAGGLIWLIPMVELYGAADFVSIGTSFTHGHFTQWGNASMEGGMERRILHFLEGAGAAAGAGPDYWGRLAGAPMVLLIMAGAAIRFRTRNGREPLSPGASALWLGSGFYILWLFWGQNVEKIRHFMPMVPLLAIALAPAAKKFPLLLLAAILALAAGNARAILAGETDMPPAIRLIHWLEKNAEPGAAVYCGWAERYFDLYDSPAKAYSVPRWEMWERIAGAHSALAGESYACNDIPGADFNGDPAAEFPPRPGDLTDKPLRLYRAPEGGYETGKF